MTRKVEKNRRRTHNGEGFGGLKQRSDDWQRRRLVLRGKWGVCGLSSELETSCARVWLCLRQGVPTDSLFLAQKQWKKKPQRTSSDRTPSRVSRQRHVDAGGGEAWSLTSGARGLHGGFLWVVIALMVGEIGVSVWWWWRLTCLRKVFDYLIHPQPQQTTIVVCCCCCCCHSHSTYVQKRLWKR